MAFKTDPGLYLRRAMNTDVPTLPPSTGLLLNSLPLLRTRSTTTKPRECRSVTDLDAALLELPDDLKSGRLVGQIERIAGHVNCRPCSVFIEPQQRAEVLDEVV